MYADAHDRGLLFSDRRVGTFALDDDHTAAPVYVVPREDGEDVLNVVSVAYPEDGYVGRCVIKS